MNNLYFPDEEIEENDLYFICYMIERVARRLRQHNRYVVNAIEREQWHHLLSVANVLHCENPLQVEDDWIGEYHLEEGTFDITKVDTTLAEIIPTPTQMGKVYCRLIVNTLDSDEDYVDGLLRIYNNPVCDVIDDYNCSAFYEPSYVQARAFRDGGFY